MEFLTFVKDCASSIQQLSRAEVQILQTLPHQRQICYHDAHSPRQRLNFSSEVRCDRTALDWLWVSLTIDRFPDCLLFLHSEIDRRSTRYVKTYFGVMRRLQRRIPDRKRTL